MKKLTLACIYFLFSCNNEQIEFYKSKWNENVDGFYTHRENMTTDLMENHLAIGMSFKDLTKILGNPDNYGSSKDYKMNYLIMEDYGWNIDPVETKTLKIELTKDSLVSKYRLEHNKH